MNSFRVYAATGRALGTCSLEELRAHVARGEIGSDGWIVRQGHALWCPICQVLGAHH